MKGSEITTEVVAEKIADLITSQNYFSKEDLVPKINAYLKAFVKIQSVPKFEPKDTYEKNILLQKQQAWILNEKSKYYASKLYKEVGAERMELYNKEAGSLAELYDINQVS